MTALLAGFLYLSWLGLFIWLGWRQHWKLLALASALLVFTFAGLYVSTPAGWAEGIIVGILVLALLAPVLLGAVTLALSKLRDRV